MKTVNALLLSALFVVSAVAHAQPVPADMVPAYCATKNEVINKPEAIGIESVCLSEFRAQTSPMRSFHKYLFVSTRVGGKAATYVVDMDNKAVDKSFTRNPEACTGTRNSDQIWERMSFCGFEAAPTGVIENGQYRALEYPKYSNGEWAHEFRFKISTFYARAGGKVIELETNDWYDVGGPRGVFLAKINLGVKR